jgi:hypothetical protein
MYPFQIIRKKRQSKFLKIIINSKLEREKKTKNSSEDEIYDGLQNNNNISELGQDSDHISM